MFKIHIHEPGSPPHTITVAGDSATIGRTEANDVSLSKPYVSSAHARILCGFVVVDLGSSNGTYVGGRRIRQNEAVLVGEQKLSIGHEDLVLQLEREDAGSAPGPDPGYGTGTLQLDAETFRKRNVDLEQQQARLERELEESQDRSSEERGAAELQRENQDLRQRLETLKADIEGRAADDGDSVQARLSAERLAEVKAQNEDLRLRLAAAEAGLEVARAAGAPATATTSASDPQLEETVRRLEEELERVREESAMPASELFAKLQKDNGALRERVKELEGGSAAPAATARTDGANEAELQTLRARVAELESAARATASAPTSEEVTPASELFMRLQRENASLREDLKKAGAPRATARAGDAHSELFVELRTENERLKSRVSELDRALLEAGSARQVPARTLGSESRGAELLARIASEDVEEVGALESGPVEDFVLLEAYRFLRQVERVATRLAGGFIQIYDPHTMFPDTEGNLRALTTELLADAEGSEHRAAFLDYLKVVRLWLVASLHARKEAAEQLAVQIKRELGEAALTADEPLSPFAKLPMQRDAELWRRVQAQLTELTAERVERRLDDLAGSVARAFVEREGADA